MRATPTPGLSRLVLLALLALGACTPQLDLDNRPPPCVSGQEVCPTSGICMSAAAVKDDKLCKQYVTVRQGASNLVPVPGFSPADVTITSSADVVATLVPSMTGSMSGSTISVSAPHGTLPGDRKITITTNVGGIAVTRDINVIVSQIAVRPDGDDQAAGTTDLPFQTLSKAASVAGNRDTVKLLNGAMSTNGVPAESAGDPPVILPAGVTIEGEDGNQIVPVRLKPQGSVSFDRVFLKERLMITVPRSTVSLHDVHAISGVTVAETAIGSSLEITGGSEILSDDVTSPGSDGPIVVRADGASLTLLWHSTIRPTGKEAVDAVQMTGREQTFTMLDTDVWSALGGNRTLALDGPTMITVQRSTINGWVEINAPTADATIATTKFAQSGGLMFRGATLMVAGCKLDSVPIEQAAPGSTVRVRDSQFLNYGAFAYRLWNGHLDLGTKDDPGNNIFQKNAGIAAGAALDIEEPPGGNNSVTVSASTFDMQPVGSFAAMGPTPPPANSIFYIANAVSISFE
jgi:Protein of unknown function (DUF1565)